MSRMQRAIAAIVTLNLIVALVSLWIQIARSLNA